MEEQETKYGIITKGLSYYAPDERFNSTKSRRIDKYFSKGSNETVEESILCLSEKDNSDQFIRGVNGEYNPECYGCWCGCGHTLEKHNSAKNK